MNNITDWGTITGTWWFPFALSLSLMLILYIILKRKDMV